MGLRTFVSFEASAPKDGDPAGGELAGAVAAALRERGLEVSGPQEHESWAWAFGSSFDGGDIFSLLALTDDPPLEWQVHSYARRGRPRLLGGAKTDVLEARITEWVKSVDAALRALDGVRSIRWYDQSTFDADHGETWFEAPTD
jgi:hypothetical protein